MFPLKQTENIDKYVKYNYYDTNNYVKAVSTKVFLYLF